MTDDQKTTSTGSSDQHAETPNPPSAGPRKDVRVERRLRIVGTILGISFILCGLGAGLGLANLLDDLPRTQDAAVRANLVGIAPHVSGPIVELRVVDNQPVSRGEVLFVVDPRPHVIPRLRVGQREAKGQLARKAPPIGEESVNTC